MVVDAAHQATFERAVSAAQTALGETDYAAATAAGARQSVEEAARYALSPDERPAPRAARGEDGTGLTPREREVAALIGRGLTSREIAAALVITERTADTHAEHIRAKLGARSRAEIAAWAVRHGLNEAAEGAG
jgi:DNA-binding CsgD family transcriptional regulator